jgi:DNA primase large subunit
MFGLGRKHNFNDGLKRDLEITTEGFKSALKEDYINSGYLSFANSELQEMLSEEFSNSWFLFLNQDAEALVEPLEKLAQILKSI